MLSRLSSRLTQRLHVFRHLERFHSVVLQPPHTPPVGEAAFNDSAVVPHASLGDVPGVQPHRDGNLVAMYTCKVCNVRSARLISKRAYEHGVVLLKCPGCLNQHLLADRLDFFGDKNEIEVLLTSHGEAIRRGILQTGPDSNVIGLQPQDLQALASVTKSVDLTTGAAVKVS